MKPLLFLGACALAAPFVAAGVSAAATWWYNAIYLPMISGEDT